MKSHSTTPSFFHAAATFLAIMLIISLGLFYLHTSLHALMLSCLIVAGCSAYPLARQGFPPIRNAMSASITRALPALYVFMLIGVLIAAFTQSGTVSTLMEYGLRFMSPAIFLPASLLLCSIMSLSVGTSWGTVGTAGIVLIGIGHAIGIPLPIVAGVIVSGACFGDKMSPVSDTTNLAAMASDVDLHRHIKSMMYTTVPSYLIILVVFYLVGLPYSHSALPDGALTALHQGLHKAHHINPICLAPFIVMLVLGKKKFSAEFTMMSASIVAIILAVTVQGAPFSEVMKSLYDGGTFHTGVATLDDLLSRGGIAAMMWTLSLSLLALALGGILSGFGFLKVLIDGVTRRVQRDATLIIITLVACFIGNISMGDAYLSIILGGQLFATAYEKRGIDPAVLSRSLEESATLTTAIIPWATTGAFFASVLGVPVIDYAPWALLIWINPLLSMVFACFGIALFKKPAVDASHAQGTTNRLSHAE